MLDCLSPFLIALQDTISGLQQRLEAIQAAVQRAERDRDMFTKVLRATERNIPNDPSHMARIDKVIMTVEAELVEAKTMEKVTEYELKHLLTQELPQLKVGRLNGFLPAAGYLSFWTCGSVCCACAQRPGLPRASPSRAR